MRLRVLALGLALAPGMALAAGADWRGHVNSRFGVSVEYPSVFTKRDPPPENGDGEVFRTTSGDASLRVYGSYNVDSLSAVKLMGSYQEAGTIYSYSKATRSWFVLSSAKGGKISYVRCALGGSDVVGCFELEYPASASAQWSSMVDRVSRSLRVGGAD